MSTRRRFLFLSVLTMLAMSVSGCVCVYAPRVSGDVTFVWTFSGQHCAIVRDVATVSIQIQNQVLENGGVYDCNNGGSDGIVLRDFRAGTYSFSIQGNNSAGTAIYSRTGSFTVNGDIVVNVDLQPTANAPGSALITWTFPPNSGSSFPNCTQAGAKYVDITIDNQSPQRVACVDGFQTTGVQIQNLTAGTHTIVLEATNMDATSVAGQGFFLYGVQKSLTVIAGTSVSSEFSLQWIVGSLPLKWQFFNNQLAQTCSQAGISRVFVNLKDSQGSFVYPGSGAEVDCLSAGVQGTVFPTLYADTYQVYVQAVGTGNNLYRSSQANPRAVQVTAGSFPQLDGQTPVIDTTFP